MLRDRKDYPRVYTPRGEAIYPAVDAPDYRFKKETGEYHARLRFSPDTPGLDDLVAQAEAIRDEAYEAKVAELTKAKKLGLLRELTKAPVIKPEVDQTTGEETGFLILRAALTARVDIKNGPKAGTSFEKKPDVFDATGRQLKNPPRVGSGSTLKLNVTIQDYETDGGKTIGCRFELNAVQIVKLVQGGQRTASDYGFGVEEDGDAIEDGTEPQGGFQDETAGAGTRDF